MVRNRITRLLCPLTRHHGRPKSFFQLDTGSAGGTWMNRPIGKYGWWKPRSGSNTCFTCTAAANDTPCASLHRRNNPLLYAANAVGEAAGHGMGRRVTFMGRVVHHASSRQTSWTRLFPQPQSRAAQVRLSQHTIHAGGTVVHACKHDGAMVPAAMARRLCVPNSPAVSLCSRHCVPWFSASNGARSYTFQNMETQQFCTRGTPPRKPSKPSGCSVSVNDREGRAKKMPSFTADADAVSPALPQRPGRHWHGCTRAVKAAHLFCVVRGDLVGRVNAAVLAGHGPGRDPLKFLGNSDREQSTWYRGSPSTSS